MKNRYIFMFILLLVTVLSCSCVFAENNTDDLSYTDNNIDSNVELGTSDEVVREANINSVDSNIESESDTIQIDNISKENYQFHIKGHTLKDIGSDKIIYKYSVYDTGSIEIITDSVKIKKGKFSINVPRTGNIFMYSDENKYLATLSYYYDDYTETFKYINLTERPYFEDYSGKYILANGSYFNNLIEEIENSDKESAIIKLYDNVKLNEPFVWNNTHIKLTISGENGVNAWEHFYKYDPFYILSAPSIIVGENSNLKLSEINLVSSRLKDSNFIINNGELILDRVLLTDNPDEPDSNDESYLILNNANLSLLSFLKTANYSTNKNRRNLIYNKGILVTEDDDKDLYSPNFDVDESNYYLYNAGQIKYVYGHYLLKNTTIKSESDYEYDIIYDNDYFFNNIYGNNVLINNSLLRYNIIFNTNNITLLNSQSYLSDEYYYDDADLTELNFNATNIMIKNCTFTNSIFTNNTIQAENIILDSNTFEFNKLFEEYTDLKIKDYNEVKLIYDHLTYTDNTLNNFKFIMSDIPSNQTNKTDDDITPSNDTKTNDDTTPTNDKKEVKQSLKVNNNPKKNNSFKGYSSGHNDIITLSQNTDITLSWLNNLFNQKFNNDTILIYINGVLVFNGSVGEDLSQVLLHISSEYHGQYTLKVVTNSGDVYTKEIYIQ